MEEEKKVDLSSSLVVAAQSRVEKQHYLRELRALQLKAYSGVLEALRASGKPNAEKEALIKTLRDLFHVPEERHKAEIRIIAYDEKLSLVSEKINGYHFTEEWACHAQRVYVPLAAKSNFSLFRSPSSVVIRGDTVSLGKPKEEVSLDEESDDVDSDTELEVVESLLKKHSICNGWQPETQRPISIAVDLGTGNEEEIEEIELQMKKKLKNQAKKPSPARSPDITEAPNTPTKSSGVLKNENKVANPLKGRCVKRKIEDTNTLPLSDSSVTSTAKKVTTKPKRMVKIQKPTNNAHPKVRIQRRSESKRAKESSEETSSADEDENGPLPALEESSRVMSPVFSEVIRTSVLGRGRGRSFRGRAGLDRRKNNFVATPPKGKAGKVRSRTPNQKASKMKNSIPTSGSRRKSKLNEKIDYDEISMDLDCQSSAKRRFKEDKRHNLDSQDSERLSETRMYKEYRSIDECGAYADSISVNFNHEDLEQVTDGVFKRPLPPSRGPKPWEIQDARLSLQNQIICDENKVNSNVHLNFGESGIAPFSVDVISSSKNHGSDVTSHSPIQTTSKSPEQAPPHKKQRIKSPIIVNPNVNPPNVSKVPLPVPVFSTSLNTASKKRHKPISVVDSLNLHLPTSATASSLAASSNNRRPGITSGGGCSMFSNSSALIAGARGTAPGILQQQRKAQPHILANSKVHQRTFLPTVSSSIGNSVSNNILPINAAPVTISCAQNTVTSNPVSAAQAVQISNSPIPISAISSVAPSSIPFQSFPGSNSPGLNISTAAMPIGHVNRTGAGTNIIFVQKANGPSVSGGATVSSNVIPLKTPPRAVILRRTQLPRQGNVMILDMQKNLVSTGQVPPFLQTARILNAPGDLSVLNMQSNSNPRKNTPSTVVSTFTPSLQTIEQVMHGSDNDQIMQSNNIERLVTPVTETVPIITEIPSLIHTTVDNSGVQQNTIIGKVIIPISESTSPVQRQDAQYAQIEAELMQMEQGNFEEVVYEEEVTTEVIPVEEIESQQYLYSNETISTSDVEVLVTTQESSHNASCASGSSTDTASENEISLNNLESPEFESNRHGIVKTVSLSPMGEAKIATDAISRALSLSRSPTKKLTFTVPVSSGVPVFSAVKSVVSSITKESPNRPQSSPLPMVFQTVGSPVKVPGMVLDGDSSTNIHIVKHPEMIGEEVVIAMNSNKDIQEPAKCHIQENTTAS